MKQPKFPTARETAMRAELINPTTEILFCQSVFHKHSAFLKDTANLIDSAADLKENVLVLDNVIDDFLFVDPILQNLYNAHDSITALNYKTDAEKEQAKEVLETLNNTIFSHMRVALEPIESYLHHHGYETEVSTCTREAFSTPIVRLSIHWDHLTH